MEVQNEVKAILNKLGLPFGEIVKSGAGFRNEVWLTDDYAIKMYNDNIGGYGKERWFYQTVQPLYAPRLIAYGQAYIILERVHGNGLFCLWRDMNDIKREAAVAQIADIACKINQVCLDGAENYFHITDDWQQNVYQRIHGNIAKLISANGIPPVLAQRVLHYTLDHVHCLDDKRMHLVYADLHFDNLIITENGKLYLLDYEMLEAGPCDLVLDVWQRMLIHPFIYANEADHAQTVPRDYQHILTWLKKYVPDLFKHPHVRERVSLYGVMYELDMLCNYPMAGLPIERLEMYLDGMAW